MIRLVLVDDHAIVLEGLAQVLRLEPDLQVVARCASGKEALQAVVTLQPDVLLLDLAMPGVDGLTVLRQLRTASAATLVVVLTAQVDCQVAREALRIGAAAIVLKAQPSCELVDVIRRVHRRQEVPLPALPSSGLDAAGGQNAEPSMLTAREREIVALAALGLRNREIAERLSITEGTVKLHLHSIYTKLGVNGRPELIRLAIGFHGA